MKKYTVAIYHKYEYNGVDADSEAEAEEIAFQAHNGGNFDEDISIKVTEDIDN